jgi:hypothetical protein
VTVANALGAVTHTTEVLVDMPGLRAEPKLLSGTIVSGCQQ